MAETPLSTFTKLISDFLANSILPSIVKGLKAKGIEVTVDELMLMIQRPNDGSTVVNPPSSNLILPSKGCIYQFKRGENKGKLCGKPVSPGFDYCSTCLKSRKSIKKTITETPKVISKEVLQETLSLEEKLSQSQDVQVEQVNVTPYDESKGLFREINHGFIVREASSGVVIVVGKLEEGTNNIVPLNEQEISIAKKIGFVIEETK